MQVLWNNFTLLIKTKDLEEGYNGKALGRNRVQIPVTSLFD